MKIFSMLFASIALAGGLALLAPVAIAAPLPDNIMACGPGASLDMPAADFANAAPVINLDACDTVMFETEQLLNVPASVINTTAPLRPVASLASDVPPERNLDKRLPFAIPIG